MPLPRVLARLNLVLTNRVTGPVARFLPGTAVVEHHGRRSGRRYRTPVLVFRNGDRYRIALTYGTDTDWVRNVRAAGGATLLTRGRRIPVLAPRIGHDPTAGWAPPPVRAMLRAVGAPDYLDCTAAPSPGR
ncbi:nitroreductase family deazaflavin-dependent oxidoreductase [Rhodococcus chondri]|uniref:Nitroreductase family deazaflavin-dependent oxidoreductase n=1 Tax=Rhodococcus chondri TaxID=3065941 RepID=A0ABU7JRL6_9NOCA|nr:nitroreductase family deazaflavin-dependent oxidoreductase [Rhodococcus sp. CC-R104]MEE2032470.1 nitroreductase family deazaflavin-dependent oxidoreductase [Rhodococcus sp. CC-R104]